VQLPKQSWPLVDIVHPSPESLHVGMLPDGEFVKSQLRPQGGKGVFTPKAVQTVFPHCAYGRNVSPKRLFTRWPAASRTDARISSWDSRLVLQR
jgi:hypothetical protein